MLAQCIGASPRQGEVDGCPHIPCSAIQIHLQRPCTIWCTLDVYFASQYISNSGPQAPMSAGTLCGIVMLLPPPQGGKLTTIG